METEYFPDYFHLRYTLVIPCDFNRLAGRKKIIFQKYFSALMQ